MIELVEGGGRGLPPSFPTAPQSTPQHPHAPTTLPRHPQPHRPDTLYAPRHTNFTRRTPPKDGSGGPWRWQDNLKRDVETVAQGRYRGRLIVGGTYEDLHGDGERLLPYSTLNFVGITIAC